MIQFYAPVSTFLLAFAAFFWNDRGTVNVLIRAVFIAAAVAGAILSAKVLNL